MARLRVRGGGEELTDPDQIRAFVTDRGLGYERWDIDRLADSPAAEGESEQDRVLRVFGPEIEALMTRGGYQSADVVALTPSTPGLDELLGKFDREHLHTEDEVRFVVDGRGVFTIHTPDDEVFDVEVHPGDLLVVPEDTWHWFTLCEDRQITCVRVFESTSGWSPHYREEAEGAS